MLSISSRLPLAVLLLVTIAILISLSSPVAAAMGNDYGGGGRVMVTIHGRGTRVGASAAAGAAPSSRLQRRLEEVVAPEFSSSLLGAGQQYINYNTLKPDRPACGDRCAAQGASYTRPCTYADKCRG